MSTHPRQIDPPPISQSDPQATELARVWGAKGGQYVTINSDLWEDPFVWGMLLVDLAGHLANAFAQERGLPKARVLRRIKEGFDSSWERPPKDTQRGGVFLASPD